MNKKLEQAINKVFDKRISIARILKEWYLKLLIFFFLIFKKSYYPGESGEANYLIEGTISLINQLIRDKWRQNANN